MKYRQPKVKINFFGLNFPPRPQNIFFYMQNVFLGHITIKIFDLYGKNYSFGTNFGTKSKMELSVAIIKSVHLGNTEKYVGVGGD